MDEMLGLFGSIVLFGIILLIIAYGIILIVPISVIAIICAVLFSFLSPNSTRNKNQAEIVETHRLYDEAKKLTSLPEDEYSAFVTAEFESLQCAVMASALYEAEGFGSPNPLN